MFKQREGCKRNKHILGECSSGFTQLKVCTLLKKAQFDCTTLKETSPILCWYAASQGTGPNLLGYKSLGKSMRIKRMSPPK